MEYIQVQENFQAKTKEKIQRQLEITTGKRMDENDIDELLVKEDIRVFTQEV